jgi:hypothetical protein
MQKGMQAMHKKSSVTKSIPLIIGHGKCLEDAS